MLIQKIKEEDFDAWVTLSLLLWPKHSKKKIRNRIQRDIKIKNGRNIYLQK